MEIPPELMLPEQRAARIAELEKCVSCAWLRFAVIDNLLVFGPFAVVIELAGRISENVAIGIGVGLVLTVTVPYL